jgi:hypothetical protein
MEISSNLFQLLGKALMVIIHPSTGRKDDAHGAGDEEQRAVSDVTDDPRDAVEGSGAEDLHERGPGRTVVYGGDAGDYGAGCA